MKSIIIFIVLFLFSIPAQSDFYFELGIGVDIYERGSRPEVNLQSPLGRFAFGVDAKDGWNAEFVHETSLPQKEIGNGLNVIWFNKRIYF